MAAVRSDSQYVAVSIDDVGTFVDDYCVLKFEFLLLIFFRIVFEEERMIISKLSENVALLA